MKNIKSKLFEKFELKKGEAVSVIGGQAQITSMDSDTNVQDGSYDVTYDTLDGSGSSQGMDTINTSTTNRDKPGNC